MVGQITMSPIPWGRRPDVIGDTSEERRICSKITRDTEIVNCRCGRQSITPTFASDVSSVASFDQHPTEATLGLPSRHHPLDLIGTRTHRQLSSS